MKMEKKEPLIINMFRDAPWPGNTLSNFAKTPFVIDDIECACSESFIQSLKVSDADDQKLFCLLSGLQAWERGSTLSEQIFTTKKLWWRGKPYNLHSPEHFKLVERGLVAKFTQSEVAREALLASGDARLIHDFGQRPDKKQSLPVDVFCKIVTNIREQLRNE